MSEVTIFEFEGSSQCWGELLQQSSRPSFFQAWGWGEFKREQGWSLQRLVIRNRQGEVVAGCQILFRKLLPFFSFAWIPGGPFPVGAYCLNAELFQVLRHQLRKRYRSKYLRIYLMRPAENELEKNLSESMKRPWVFLNSGRSVLVNLTSTDDDFLANMTRKHRYYVRQAQKKSIQWKSENSSDQIREFSSLMAQMGRIKRKNDLALSAETLERLVFLWPGGVRVLVGYFEDQPITGAVVLGQGRKAWYLHAASNEQGRKLGAAYAMIAEMARRLRQEGFQEMDFGGLGPETPAFQGTNHFKRGFGGKMVTYVGEWEAGSALERFIGNTGVFLKRG